MENPKLPLVYSCSGCSSAAQMANQLAIRLDRAGLAQAGVAPDRHLVLGDYGVRKRKHADVDPQQAAQVFEEHVRPEAVALAARDGGRAC